MENFINTIVFSSGILQGILLVIILLQKRSKKLPNLFLGIFIGVVTLQAIIKLHGTGLQSGIINPVYFLLYYLPYLYGPLVYFYIKKSITENFVLDLKMILHLIPFMISILIVLTSGYDIIQIFDYIDINVYNIIDTIIQIIILSVYILAGKKLLNWKANAAKADANFFDLIKWYNSFTNVVWISGISLIILFTLVFYNVELLNLKFDNSSIAFLLLPMMIYWISYNAFIKPELFFNRNNIVFDQREGKKLLKYQNNQLAYDEISNILDRIDTFVVKNKGFLNPELSLDLLSRSVNIPRHHISQAINQTLNINFNDYINFQRIEFVKKELLNPAKKHYNIAALAFESGFNSISTFNEVFKKFTSMTPSEFKKSKKYN